MKFKDDFDMRGDFELKVYRKGVLIERAVEENLILNRAKVLMAHAAKNEAGGVFVNRIAFGTSSIPADPDDTALTSAYVKNIGGHTYPASGQIKFDWTLSGAEANGKTIREFGLMLSDGSLFARKVRGGIEKDDDISLVGSWTIKF